MDGASWPVILAFFLGVVFGAIALALVASVYVEREDARAEEAWRRALRRER